MKEATAAYLDKARRIFAISSAEDFVAIAGWIAGVSPANPAP